MRTRVTALSVVVFTATGLASSATLAQTAGRSGSGSRALLPSRALSWGDPDLQGVWDYRTITPMERRAELGDRAYYTDEEVAQLEGRAARRMEQPPDENTPVGLVHAEYLTDPGRYVDESRRTSLIVDPANGRMPPLTPEAQARQDRTRAARAAAAPARPGGRADSYTDRSLLERCITRGSAGLPLPTLYNNNIRIAQAPGFVAIVHEMVHETRLVPLDGSAFGNVRSYLGESRGHWEGDTLVVETRNFNGKAPYRGAGDESARHGALHARRPRQDRLQGHVRGRRRSGRNRGPRRTRCAAGEGELYEYACHEGNYGLRNILENARDEERKAAGAAR